MLLNGRKSVLYPERALKEVPPKVVKQYFVNEGHFYQVKDEIKRTVTFKQQNLLEDRYDTGFDLNCLPKCNDLFHRRSERTNLYELLQSR